MSLTGVIIFLVDFLATGSIWESWIGEEGMVIEDCDAWDASELEISWSWKEEDWIGDYQGQ